MSAWKQRKKALESLGFTSYGEYLESDLWKAIRRKRWARRDTLECHYCGGKPDQLHHESYDRKTLLGKKLEALTPVCSDCHEYGSTDGKSVFQPAQASKRMRERAKRLGLKPKGIRKPVRARRRRRRGRGRRRRKGRVPAHIFEALPGSALCALCDRSEESHGKAEEGLRRKAAKRARRGPSKKAVRRAAQIAEGEAILAVIDGRGKMRQRAQQVRRLGAIAKAEAVGAVSQRLRAKHEAECRAALESLRERRLEPPGGQSADRRARKQRRRRRC